MANGIQMSSRPKRPSRCLNRVDRYATWRRGDAAGGQYPLAVRMGRQTAEGAVHHPDRWLVGGREPPPSGRSAPVDRGA